MQLSALRHPEFRLYFAGAVAVVNAMWVVRIVIAWLAWDITGSPAFTGTVAAASLVPTLALGPFFGVLVDRSDVVRAAYATNLSMTACVACLLGLHLAGLVTPLALVVLALAIGTVTAAHHPVRLSLGPRLVPAEAVASVVALSALNFNVARLVSPALGGLMIERLGIGGALAVTLALFLPNLAILWRLHPRALATARAPRFATAMAEGFAYIAGRPEIVAILAATCLFSIPLRGVLEVLPLVADGVFARGASGFGQLGSAVGAGALASAAAKTLGLFDGRSPFSGRALAVAGAGFVALGVMATAQSWAAVLASAALLGAAGTWFGVTMQQIIQNDLPDDMRGRVMSVWVVVGLGATATGAWATGLIASITSVPVALAAMALAGAAGFAALALWGRRRLRQAAAQGAERAPGAKGSSG